MRTRRNAGLAALIAVLAAALAVGLSARDPERDGRTDRVRSTADFIDSVGVTVHFNYVDTSYGRQDVILQRLRELGIRHLRDAVPVRAPALAGGLRAAADAGIRPTLVNGIEIDPATGVAAAENELGRAIVAFEAANEIDNSGLPDWEKRLAAHQSRLRAAVRERLPGLPIVGPSFVDPVNHAASRRSTYEFMNFHPYPGGRAPEEPLRDALDLLPPDERAVFTETGYHNAIAAQEGQPPVPEAVAATYLPRLLLTAFSAGVRRTFIYELADEKPDPRSVDPEQHFGLLRQDLSPKPAFTALRNLLRALEASPGAPSEPPPELAVEASERVERVALRREDGSRVVALWRPVEPWDRDARRSVDTGAATVELRWPRAVRDVELVRPGAGVRPQWRRASARSARLELEADVVLVSYR